MEKYPATTVGLKVQHKKVSAPGRLLLKRMILISSQKKKKSRRGFKGFNSVTSRELNYFDKNDTKVLECIA